MVLTEHRVVEGGSRHAVRGATGLRLHDRPVPAGFRHDDGAALPSRLRGKAIDAPTHLRLASEPGALPGWLILGQVPGRELAFGAIGRFWTADIEWRPVEPADFAAFDEPGWGKIACHLLVRPDGPGRSVLTYECRTATTDPDSRHSMGRYWWAIRPFVGYVLRASLRTIARDAERCP